MKAIGDLGYRGTSDLISVPNNTDSLQVKKFKSRALKRHKKFNGLIKNFDCLNSCFRNSQAKFKLCFEAVCVICQYQIEVDQPLFDILVEDVLRSDEENTSEDE